MKSNKTSFNILFTSAGRRIELIQAFRESAKRLGMELRIHGADMMTHAPALSFCDAQHQVSRIDNPAYIPTLLKICDEQRIDLLIPTIDTDLLILSQSKPAFGKIGTQILVADESVIDIASDKRNTYKFFKNTGVATPETFDNYSEYNLDFPCFIKPYAGSASKDAYSVPDRESLEEYARTIPDYIVQNKIVGEEFTVDALCDFEGAPVYITPRRRLQVRAGEVLTTEILDDKVVVEECRQILAALKGIGPLTIQYIKERTTGVNYYIEINPRFGGGSPLSMKAGANSAEVLLRILRGEKIEPNPGVHSAGAIYSRFDQSIRSNPLLVSVDSLTDVAENASQYDAVVFDLDDTLYDEVDYVKSGFKAVAEVFPEEDTYSKLLTYFREGKPAIDALLNDMNCNDEALKGRCLEVYRNNKPQIKLADDVRGLLQTLRRSGKKLGIITDGRPDGQRAKIAALGLDSLVDEIIITDELAGATGNVMNFRKPNNIAFVIMLDRLGVALSKMVYVGDNPSKDFHPARSLGFDAIRYNNKRGLYG